jgi:uncharacterized heparinase superfamily protein
VEALWTYLASQSYPAITETSPEISDAIADAQADELIRRADMARSGIVDFLGSGPTHLGSEIDWSRDYTSGHRWGDRKILSFDYIDLDIQRDVKFPWELSRMQWLIPLAQTHVLSLGHAGDAQYVRTLIEDWIAKNPFGASINWACTMDVAIRATTWTWLFHVFADAPSWNEPSFRKLFISSLFQHGLFIENHLELSDINGNHLLTNAAGLVFLGYFFTSGRVANRWTTLGRRLLETEILKQVFEDGVDHEGSIPYHRLAQELFLYPALFARLRQEPMSAAYLQRLSRMADFTEAYSRMDDSAPVIGDADDGRFLPFGNQNINDHTYLVPVSRQCTTSIEKSYSSVESALEVLFVCGTSTVPKGWDRGPSPTSRVFPQGGFYVLRNGLDHVTVDCGPIGLRGQGGHGHNDALSFEAVLCGQSLIVDSGSYVYTSDFRARNRFRSTQVHNTPQVDGLEINRLFDERLLWLLQDDAKPEMLRCRLGSSEDRLQMKHTGYHRLSDPVTVFRTLTLNHDRHSLAIEDAFEARESHSVSIPYHLAPGVQAEIVEHHQIHLIAGDSRFVLRWESRHEWATAITDSEYSPSYGVVLATQQVVFSREGVPASLAVEIEPLT